MSSYHVLNAVWIGVFPMLAVSVLIGLLCYILCCLNQLKIKFQQYRKKKQLKKTRKKLHTQQKRKLNGKQALQQQQHQHFDEHQVKSSLSTDDLYANTNEHSFLFSSSKPHHNHHMFTGGMDMGMGMGIDSPTKVESVNMTNSVASSYLPPPPPLSAFYIESSHNELDKSMQTTSNNTNTTTLATRSSLRLNLNPITSVASTHAAAAVETKLW